MQLRKVFLTLWSLLGDWRIPTIWPWVKLALLTGSMVVLRHWVLKNKIRFKERRDELNNYYSFTQIILRVNNSSKVWAPCLEMIGIKRFSFNFIFILFVACIVYHVFLLSSSPNCFVSLNLNAGCLTAMVVQIQEKTIKVSSKINDW